MLSSNYYMDPDLIRFDDKYVIFNPMHNELEYEATKANIQKLGQLEPILMLNGICVDGRHRTRVARELGVQVLCSDLDNTMTEEEIIMTCNRNTMSGRDYDNAQKAIQALRLVNEYKMQIVTAAKLMKIDRRIVSYASTIKGFNRQDILDTLMKDKQNRVQLDNMERPSRSLELLAKYVKTISEKPKLIVDDSERIQWEPDAMIKTETGKAWYYDTIEGAGIELPLSIRMLLVEMANMKFKLEETPNE